MQGRPLRADEYASRSASFPPAFDFTPSGAQTYRTVSAAIFGLGWEDGVTVQDTYYWEEHHYCTAESGLAAALSEHEYAGRKPTSVRTTPIGPWCVYWWKRFSSGYRYELTFGEP